MKNSISLFLLIIAPVIFLLGAMGGERTGSEQALNFTQDVTAGKRLYRRKCAMCHGTNGKGDGMVSRYIFPKPRDFSSGIFKIHSTPTGSLPTDQDLFDTITRGMPGTLMPSWANLSVEQRWHLVEYLKTLISRFAEEEILDPIIIGQPKPPYAESINVGRRLYIDLECWACHGMNGRGNGPSSYALKDDWGFPIVPADLTVPGNWRGGSLPQDIYRSIRVGIGGTPMPSWEALTEDQTWDITNYLLAIIDQ